MAAKKKGSKKVTIEVDVETLKKLIEAADALADLASSHVQGSDDPAVRKLGKKKGRRK